MDGAFPNEPGRSFDSAGRGPRPGAGAGAGAGAGRGFRGTAENAKTKLCTRWMSGDCRFGDRCNFAHGEHELRSLPPRSDSFGRGGYGGAPPRAGGGYGGGAGGPMGGRGGGPGGGRGRYDDYYGGGGSGYGGQQGGFGGPGGGGYGGPQDGFGGGGGGGYGAPARGPAEDPYARQGYPVTGPNGWVAYRTQDTGETYYHNHNTGVTQWDRPPEWLGPISGHGSPFSQSRADDGDEQEVTPPLPTAVPPSSQEG